MKKEQKVVASAFATRHHYKELQGHYNNGIGMKSTPMDVNML
jgi:hypothetical protein